MTLQWDDPPMVHSLSSDEFNQLLRHANVFGAVLALRHLGAGRVELRHQPELDQDGAHTGRSGVHVLFEGRTVLDVGPPIEFDELLDECGFAPRPRPPEDFRDLEVQPE